MKVLVKQAKSHPVRLIDTDKITVEEKKGEKYAMIQPSIGGKPSYYNEAQAVKAVPKDIAPALDIVNDQLGVLEKQVAKLKREQRRLIDLGFKTSKKVLSMEITEEGKVKVA